MRMLGLIMMVVGFILAAAFWFLISVGGFPANLPLTCGFWGVIGVAGLIIFASKPAKKKE